METWQNPLTPVVWLGAGIILLLILLLFLFAFVSNHRKRMREEKLINHALQLKHQEKLLLNSVEIQEKERARIAAELHDDLIAQLVRMKLINSDEVLNELLGKSIEKARKLSHDLTPPLLDKHSMPELLIDFLQPMEKQFSIQTSFHELHDDGLKLDAKLQVLRIFQEVITNIVKHAKATQITVFWRTSSKGSCLLVKDNGIGFTPKEETGLGLKNIELRTQIIRGRYRFRSNQGSANSFLLLFKTDGE